MVEVVSTMKVHSPRVLAETNGPQGFLAVVFGGENVGVPADEEGDSVATPFQLSSGGSIRDGGGWCAQLTLPLCEPKSESLFGDPKERKTCLMKIKGNL